MKTIDRGANDKKNPKLRGEDLLELQIWVEQIGLERAARIVGVLGEASGRAGRPPKPESLMLLKIAHMKRRDAKRKLYSIAKEIAEKAHPYRKPWVSLESLISKLVRDFRQDRQFWLWLALKRPEPAYEAIFQDCGRRGSSAEYRVLDRIIKVMPRPMDLFDAVALEAAKLGDLQFKLVKKAGRERIESSLSRAIGALRSRSLVTGDAGVQRIPRNFFDLVTLQFGQIISDSAASSGQKSGQLNPM